MCNVGEEIQQRRSLARNIRVFKSHFGKHPLHLSRVWKDLQVYNLMTREEAKDKMSFKGFLIGETFMKTAEPHQTCATFIQKLEGLERLYENAIA